LFDPEELERARVRAGLLPADLARGLRHSLDYLAAVMRGKVSDHELTLADLRRLAQTVGVPPLQLLQGDEHGPRATEAARIAPSAVAMVYRLGAPLFRDVVQRLGVDAETLAVAIDEYNAQPGHGLNLASWNGTIVLIPDPEFGIFDPGTEDQTDGDLTVPSVEQRRADALWAVIDRSLPDRFGDALIEDLGVLEAQGVITQTNAEGWRPSDTVIDVFKLMDWDPQELLDFVATNQPPEAREEIASPQMPRRSRGLAGDGAPTWGVDWDATPRSFTRLSTTVFALPAKHWQDEGARFESDQDSDFPGRVATGRAQTAIGTIDFAIADETDVTTLHTSTGAWGLWTRADAVILALVGLDMLSDADISQNHIGDDSARA